MGSVAKLFKMKALLIFILLGAMNLQRGDSVQWVLGPQGEGDCHEICATKKGTCDERIGREAASDPNRVNFTGIGCKGRNGWDYGQGFSQCLDKGCCWDSSCQFHCSATSRWPGCKMENGTGMVAIMAGFVLAGSQNVPSKWTKMVFYLAILKKTVQMVFIVSAPPLSFKKVYLMVDGAVNHFVESGMMWRAGSGMVLVDGLSFNRQVQLQELPFLVWILLEFLVLHQHADGTTNVAEL